MHHPVSPYENEKSKFEGPGSLRPGATWIMTSVKLILFVRVYSELQILVDKTEWK